MYTEKFNDPDRVKNRPDYRTDYNGVPPIPVIKPCVIYPPRKVPSTATDGEFVFALITAYTTTMNFYAEQRGLNFSYAFTGLYNKLKKDPNEIVKGKDVTKYNMVLSFRELVDEKLIAPVDWMEFCMLSWLAQGNKSVPPLAYVFPKGNKRKTIYGLYRGQYYSGKDSVTHAFCPRARELMVLHNRMLQDLRLLKGPSQSDVNAVVSKYFPGNAYQQMLAEAVSSNQHWEERLMKLNRGYNYTPRSIRV